jgi:succinate dehydrogenase / fumarate reductase flavoprotein subunit
VADIGAAIAEVDVRPSSEGYGDLAHVLDLRASLTTAEATLRGALARTESRGAHNRSDHPQLDERMAVNFVARKGDDGPSIERRPVPSVPEERRALIEAAPIESFAGRLLE